MKKAKKLNRTQENLDSTFDSESVFIKDTRVYSKVLGLSRKFPNPYDYEMALMWDTFLEDIL